MPQAKQPPPVQFRPGPLLGRWLADLAVSWKVNENEVARRLAALAASRLDLAGYVLLVQLADALAPPGVRPDFASACHHVRTALDGANRARQDRGDQPLMPAEIVSFITRTVREESRRQRARQARAQQEQQIRVKVQRTHG